MRPAILNRVGIPILTLLAGCVMPQYGTFTHPVDIAGGETIQVPFIAGRPIPAEDDDFRVVIASMRPVGPDLYLLFSLYSKNGSLPRRVIVEDVAGTEPELFVDDHNPEFVADPRNPTVGTRTWAWKMGPLIRTNWRPTWFHDPDESVRVYRFTVTTADGRTVVLYQGTSYPAPVKAFILKSLPEAPQRRTDSAEQVPM
jgi:hypothetical protein